MAVTLDTLKKSIGKKKAKSMAFAWLADYENMAGDVDNALARVDAGLQMYPGDIPGMLVRSKILFQKGRFKECVKECEKVLEKEPFCLSAQKRMGEAYEQMENLDERNRCFRRVHDMDPLDMFWKEEYETVSDTAAVAGAVAGAAAAEALGDADFSMPDFADMGEPQAQESTVAEAPSTAEQKPAEDDSPFSKSLDMNLDAPAEDFGSMSASPFSTSHGGDEEDPFAALAALGGDDNSVEESAMDSLQQSLNTALSEASAEAASQNDIPASEEISGHDVGSAFADLFGEEDDLDSLGGGSSQPAFTPAKPAAPAAPVNASPFAQFDLPSTLEDEPEPKEEAPAKSVFGNEIEDKPQSVDSAFNDIFGEDELPEELPAAKPAAPVEPKQKVNLDAWNPEPADAGGLFQKSASADMGFGASEESLALEEPALEEKPEKTLDLPAEDPADKPQSLDSAFADIFGEDELPEELPAAKPAEKPAIEESMLSLDEPAPAKAEVSDELDLSGWAPGGNIADEPAAEVPAVEPVAVEPVVEPAPAAAPEAPAAEVKSAFDGEGFGIDKAFDELFAEKDELPDESAAKTAAVPTSDKVSAVGVAEKPAQNVAIEKEELDREMGAAFSSLFADEDKFVPEDKPAVEAPTQEDTGAKIEEAPLADAALEADLDKSFNNLFGEDTLPDESAAKTSAPAVNATVAPAAPAAAPIPELSSRSSDLESLESEFSGAFKQLFNTDDDSLDEKPVPPSNKGVDFLMSGDSDDEVSAGLVTDPTAPLDKLPPDIDESLNTPTLAEIYFEQGLYGKALDIYQDLARKEPGNKAIAQRLAEIEAAYQNRFGGGINGRS
ncbi:hypothetical protein [Fibrobacter succinogenes]|uniref:hypothetical protein n=1 Tax=Fibrobacter succinogenes TaxID=833 RepID=UPI0015638691|nr:hypothetical protein [Fibrobacter succinogenes]